MLAAQSGEMAVDGECIQSDLHHCEHGSARLAGELKDDSWVWLGIAYV